MHLLHSHTGVPMHQCALTHRCPHAPVALTHRRSHAPVCTHTQAFPCTCCTHTQVSPCTSVNSHTGVPMHLLHSHTGVPMHRCALTHKCVHDIGSVPPNTPQMFPTGREVPWSFVARSSPGGDPSCLLGVSEGPPQPVAISNRARCPDSHPGDTHLLSRSLQGAGQRTQPPPPALLTPTGERPPRPTNPSEERLLPDSPSILPRSGWSRCLGCELRPIARW